MTTDELSHAIQNAPLRLIAGRIRQARRGADKTLDQLGEDVGTSRHHLIRLEGGKHRPRPAMLTAIARETARPVEFFLVEEAGEPNPFPPEAA